MARQPKSLFPKTPPFVTMRFSNVLTLCNELEYSRVLPGELGGGAGIVTVIESVVLNIHLLNFLKRSLAIIQIYISSLNT